MNYRTILVDDDFGATERLKNLLLSINAPCEIIGEAKNGYEAIDSINDLKPDLVFLDIGLPGIDGIELLRHCIHSPFIIFTTAFDRFALNAFEANTVSYLLKPITKQKLQLAILKLEQMIKIGAGTLANILQPLKGSTCPLLQYLPVKTSDKILMLNLDSIVWVRAEGKYTVISTGEKQYISNYTISELEERFSAHQFFRLNRSYVINVQCVREFTKSSSGKWKVNLNVPMKEELIMGNKYFEKIRERLGMK